MSYHRSIAKENDEKARELWGRHKGKLRIVAILALIFWIAACSIQIVPEGHVGVPKFLGEFSDSERGAGPHLGNPFASWTLIDCRGRSLDQPQTPIPSADAQTTKIDFSLQYRYDCPSAVSWLREHGGPAAVIRIHLVPQFRSIVREKGKGVARSQDYYSEATQAMIQGEVLAAIQEKVRVVS